MKDMGSGNRKYKENRRNIYGKNRVAKNSYTVFCSKGKG